MVKKGKRYQDSMRRYDRASAYAPTEALDLVKFMASARFDESVEAAFRLGVDPRRADQMLRGNVSFPHGTGRTVRVAVFAPPERHSEAVDAGRRHSGSGRSDQGDLRRRGARLRHSDRRPRHDAAGGKAGADPRTARPDAQSQGRHG